jgi:environmental stress-induced protein Ves
MITVRAADVPALPWKNGGGVSRDLLCWPNVARLAGAHQPGRH